MSYPANQQAYSANGGATPVTQPHIDVRDPNATDINWPIGQQWENQPAARIWRLNNFAVAFQQMQANWIQIAPTTGVLTLTGSTNAVPVNPDGSGNINLVAGTNITINGGVPGVNDLTISSTGGGGGSVTIDGDSGSVTGSTIDLYANSGSANCGASVSFTAASATELDLVVTDGNDNTVIGFNAGKFGISGAFNTAFGSDAYSSGGSSGNNNTFIGQGTGVGVKTGSGNTAIGASALPGSDSANNTAVGFGALGQGCGNSNIGIGNNVGQNYSTTEANNILIGNFGIASENNAIHVGTQGAGAGQQNTCFIAGIYNNNSSGFTSPKAVYVGSNGQLGYGTGGSTPNQQQIYYVAKNGSDTNSGLNIESSFLTFGAAILAASAMTPSATNRFVISCIDDGIYTEDITGVPYVDIFAPNATIVATATGLTVADNSNYTLLAMQVPDAAFGVIKVSTDTATSWVNIAEMTCAGTGVGFVNASNMGGVLQCEWKTLTINDGVGVGDISTGHMHVRGGDIYIVGVTGNAIALGRANPGSIVGHVDHILIEGAGAAGTALFMQEGLLDLNINTINATAAINIDGTAGSCTLNLFCNDINGTQANTNGAILNIWSPIPSGISGQFLQSQGSGSPPQWLTVTPGAGIGAVAGDVGSVTGATISLLANSSSASCGATVSFTAASATELDLVVTDANANTLVGASAGNAAMGTGGTNTGLGKFVLASVAGSGGATGNDNTAVGYASCFASTSANSNTGIGSQALFTNIIGNANTAVGFHTLLTSTGDNNSSIGNQSLSFLTTGTDNIAIGNLSGINYVGAESSNILVGIVPGVVGDNNTIRIGVQGSGDGQQNTCYIAGITGVTTANSNYVTVDTTTGQLGSTLVVPGAGISAVVRQVFTSSGTYTPTAGMVQCEVEVVGGGGGGGGCSNNHPAQAGGGGGAGGYAKKIFAAATIGASQTITIGAAGAGAAAGFNPGGPGGQTNFGGALLVYATGGGGGGGSASGGYGTGGAGGVGSNGDFNTVGCIGTGGSCSDVVSFGGNGGCTYFGGNGQGYAAYVNSIPGGNAFSYGGGGGGGACGPGASIVGGGNGFAGVCIITEYVS